jgi:hypothetical protein
MLREHGAAGSNPVFPTNLRGNRWGGTELCKLGAVGSIPTYSTKSMTTRSETFELFERIDRAYKEGRFAEVDEEILNLNVGELSTQMLVNWLAVGNWARDKLKNYEPLLWLVTEELKHREPDRYKGLVRGFEQKRN